MRYPHQCLEQHVLLVVIVTLVLAQVDVVLGGSVRNERNHHPKVADEKLEPVPIPVRLGAHGWWIVRA